MVTALALGCTFTGGTTEGPRSGGGEIMFHEPNATRNGVMAALLARENVKGSEMALEGAAGFYNAFTGNNEGRLSYAFVGPNETSLAQVAADLGDRWELMHVTPKMYPTAGYNCPVIDLMTQIRSRHPLNIAEIESITVDMNWLETLYPSPAFPNEQRSQPGVGSTHYYTAYTCVRGSFPPLSPRMEPGQEPAARDPEVMDLLKRVEVVGHRDRPAFAPRITINMQGGTVYRGEYQGNELEWGLATEIERIQPLFEDIPWPTEGLHELVNAVSGLEEASDLSHLIQLCVRQWINAGLPALGLIATILLLLGPACSSAGGATPTPQFGGPDVSAVIVTTDHAVGLNRIVFGLVDRDGMPVRADEAKSPGVVRVAGPGKGRPGKPAEHGSSR